MADDFLQAGFILTEPEAYNMLEKIRWPDGPICPHCQARRVYRLKPSASGRRVLKCGECRKQFSVTVGTIFEDSHIALSKWVFAVHMLCASKKGMSAHQLHRMLGVTYKTAWFMAHRIRHAMKQTPALEKLSQGTGIVEADETFIGGKRRDKTKHYMDNKAPVFTLVERDGKARSFSVPDVKAKNLREILREHVARDAKVMTDQSSVYFYVRKDFPDHQRVNHVKKEWKRGNVHESYFSILKRGIYGTYHHVSKRHLQRYLSEFDFRYNARKVDDATRMFWAVKATEGKRLQYR